MSKHNRHKAARNEAEFKALSENMSVTMHADRTEEVIDCIASAIVDLYFEKQNCRPNDRLAALANEEAA